MTTPTSNPNAADLDHVELLQRLLQGHLHVAPTGTRVTARRIGRLFVLVDADRLCDHPFPAEVAEVADPIGDTLAHLAVLRRGRSVCVSNWGQTGYLHAPTGCAAEMLAVLLALDAGDVRPAEAIADMILACRQNLSCGPTKALRRHAAVHLVEWLERDIPMALAGAGRP